MNYSRVRNIIPLWLVIIGIIFHRICFSSEIIDKNSIEIILDLYHEAGRIKEEERNAIFSPSAWRGVAYYEPIASIPGITMHLTMTGDFIKSPTLRDDEIIVKLKPENFLIDQKKISTTIEKTLRFGLYKLKKVEIDNYEKNKIGMPDIWLSTVSIDIPDSYVTKSRPIALSNAKATFAGSLVIRQFQEQPLKNTNIKSKEALGWLVLVDGVLPDGKFKFLNLNKFSPLKEKFLYENVGKENIVLSANLPRDLIGLNLRNKTMKTIYTEDHQIDFIHISSKIEKENCILGHFDLSYMALYVDKIPVSISIQNVDQSLPDKCIETYSRVEIDDNRETVLHLMLNTDYGAKTNDYASKSNRELTSSEIADVLMHAKKMRLWFAAQ